MVENRVRKKQKNTIITNIALTTNNQAAMQDMLTVIWELKYIGLPSLAAFTKISKNVSEAALVLT